ncbi:hypothetical protein ACFL39_01860 [Gemmatimonadota bacterium]
MKHNQLIMFIVVAGILYASNCSSKSDIDIQNTDPLHVSLDTLFIAGGSDASNDDLIYRGYLQYMPFMDVDESGNIWILNTGAGRLDVYAGDGSKISSFGRKGNGPGEFERPYGLNASKDVAWTWDGENQQLCQWDLDLGLLQTTRTEIGLSSLWHLTVGPDGQLWFLRAMPKDEGDTEIPVNLIEVLPDGTTSTQMELVAPGLLLPTYSGFTYMPVITSAFSGELVIAPTFEYELVNVSRVDRDSWKYPSYNLPYRKIGGFSIGGEHYDLPPLSHYPDIFQLIPVNSNELWIRTYIESESDYIRYDRVGNDGVQLGSYWLPRTWWKIRIIEETLYVLDSNRDEGIRLIGMKFRPAKD